MKELSVQDRAKQALSIEHTEKELESLAKKFADITEIASSDDYRLVKGACREFQKVRVSIEKAGMSARDDANKFAKAVLSEQKRLLDIVVPEEDRLKALRKEVDDKAVREAAEKVKKEEERKAKIEERVATIRGLSEFSFGVTSKELRDITISLSSVNVTEEDFQEFFDEAVIAKNAGITKLTAAIAEKEELEKLRALQEEQEKKQAEEQSWIDAENEKIRLAQEAIEKEKREIEAKKLAEAEATARKLKEENEKLEREKRAKEAAEQKKAEEEAEKARQEDLKPEKEKLIGWITEFSDGGDFSLTDDKLVKVRSDLLEDLGYYIKKIEEL